MKSVKYLELVRQKHKLKTDGEVADLLGISRSAVNHYSTGRRIMDRETCARVAMALNLNEHEAMQLIAATAADQAEQSGEKSLWEVFMSRGAAVAASVLMATSVNLFLTPTPAEAATMRATESSDSSQYRLCEVRYRRRRTVLAWFKRMFVPAALRTAAS
jgi:predicted transcriptional regulator